MARIKSAKSHNQKAESSFLSNVFIGGVLGFLIFNVVNHFSNGDNDYKFIGFIIGFSVACFFLIRGLSLYSENNEDNKFVLYVGPTMDRDDSRDNLTKISDLTRFSPKIIPYD